MTKNKKIVAMIPARIGSERLKKKNLALVDNKPLIFYSINAAIKSKIFDEIYINSDDLIFEDIE
jgi:CMP-N-acetylneuraminic acid synthetase